MSEIPPTSLPRPPRYDPWQTIADTLKRHPGIWHNIAGDASTATTNINDGVLAAFRPAGTFEAVRRHGSLQVRYVDDHVAPNPDPTIAAPEAGATPLCGAPSGSRIWPDCLKPLAHKGDHAANGRAWPRDPNECVVCDGTGVSDDDPSRPCFICSGTGVVR
jgi:hypothetical protein